MKSTGTVCLVIGGVALGTAFVLFTPGFGAESSTPTAETEGRHEVPDLGAVHRQLDELRGDVAALRARGFAQSRLGARGSTLDEASRAATEDEHAETSAAHDAPNPLAEQEYASAMEADLELQLEHEGRDADWSVETERSIVDALNSETLAGATLLDARCHSSLCRVEIGHDNEVAQEDFLTQMPLMPPFDTSGFVRLIDNGDSREMVVFFAREGHELPMASG